MSIKFINEELGSLLTVVFWLLNTGTGAPYLVDVVKEDGEHLVVTKVPGPNDSSPV